MMDWDCLIDDVRQVFALAGVSIPTEAMTLQVLPAPHAPPRFLPKGKMAVYVFFWDTQCLKVGKVGSKSGARYTTQHYNSGSTESNLAKSILKDKEDIRLAGVNDDNIGQWISHNTGRVNVLLDAVLGVRVLGLVESFLQCRLKPKYEGFESQA